MQKVNVYVHIWNELRSNDRFGFNFLSYIYRKNRGVFQKFKQKNAKFLIFAKSK
jgi:hypothetical protein